MTRRDILNCAHEPFGDAFYYGPERLSERFADDEEARIKSGFAKSTYRTIMDRLENDGKEVRINPPLPSSLDFEPPPPEQAIRMFPPIFVLIRVACFCSGSLVR